MESVYADDFIAIVYYKNTCTLSGVWNNCQNKAHYNYSLNVFRDFFGKMKPKNTLWNNRNLDIRLCEDLQKRANTLINETGLKQEFNGKTALVLDESSYTKFLMSNICNELDKDLKLRYFQREKDAIDWIAAPLCAEEVNLFPQLQIEDADEHNYNISLTVSKNEFHEYASILGHLLKNRNFCLENAETFNSLTCREREVLQYIVKGFKNHDIADYLFLSVETVKTHRKNILSKLNCPNTYSLSQYLMFFKD